ncbi:MAG: SDR family NAD(P)-dependent oxidoreductase [Clostridiaceae bacterium]|nr:SDR family NAD(P)-dependent oxidoreductase [Clostridiaceae bacterium]
MDGWFLITGATGGLGRAFCAACARRGFRLFLTDRSEEALDTLAGGLRHAYGISVRTASCDLATDAGRDALAEVVGHAGIRLSGMIHVAGIDAEGEFTSLSLGSLRAIMQVNMLSVAENIHQMLRFRQMDQPFRIINVASLAAFQPMPYKALYAATKRFLVQFSLGIREELLTSGVSVTVLCPCGMPTTPVCIAEIEAQGIAGRLTTMNPGTVAEYTLDKALRGKAIVVPGTLNRCVRFASDLLPATWTARWVRRQWSGALMKRCGTLRSPETGGAA